MKVRSNKHWNSFLRHCIDDEEAEGIRGGIDREVV
jgi:hypothetical protein